MLPFNVALGILTFFFSPSMHLICNLLKKIYNMRNYIHYFTSLFLITSKTVFVYNKTLDARVTK